MRLPQPSNSPRYLSELVRTLERELAQCVKKQDGAVLITPDQPLHIMTPDRTRYAVTIAADGTIQASPL